MHRFLSLPEAEDDAEVLIPVEMVVLTKPSAELEIRLATGKGMPDEIELHTRSQRSTEVDPVQLINEPQDPLPLSQDLQHGVKFDRIGLTTQTILMQEGAPTAKLTKTATSGVTSLNRSMTDIRIAAVPPVAKETTDEPRLAVKRSPELSVMLMASDVMEISSDPAIPVYQGSTTYISDADPLPPHSFLTPAVKPAVVFWEAKGRTGRQSLHMASKATAGLAVTLSIGQAIPELRQSPKEVADLPRLMIASLQLNSHPLGAQVFVDGLPSGETPLDLELPVGKHELRLVLPDHYDWKAQIELTDRSKPYPIFLRLLPVE
jgi:hypothetical protein